LILVVVVVFLFLLYKGKGRFYLIWTTEEHTKFLDAMKKFGSHGEHLFLVLSIDLNNYSGCHQIE